MIDNVKIQIFNPEVDNFSLRMYVKLILGTLTAN